MPARTPLAARVIALAAICPRRALVRRSTAAGTKFGYMLCECGWNLVDVAPPSVRQRHEFGRNRPDTAGTNPRSGPHQHTTPGLVECSKWSNIWPTRLQHGRFRPKFKPKPPQLWWRPANSDRMQPKIAEAASSSVGTAPKLFGNRPDLADTSQNEPDRTDVYDGTIINSSGPRGASGMPAECDAARERRASGPRVVRERRASCMAAGERDAGSMCAACGRPGHGT